MSPLIPLKMSKNKVFCAASEPEPLLRLEIVLLRDFICSPPSLREFVDLAGGITCAEAIVDIDDGHTAAATVEHSQQRSQTAEAGPISDAGRNRNNRFCNQPGDDARESAF